MINYAFEYVDEVIFHVGDTNFRSQKAVEKLGALKMSEEARSFSNGPIAINFIYKISKADWN